MTFRLGHREAEIVYDLSLSQSVISRRFANTILSTIHSDSLTTSVSVPCIGGYFTSELTFNIRPRLAQSDAVLGSDWMDVCRIAVEDSVVSFSSRSPEAALHKKPTHSSLVGSGTSFTTLDYPFTLIPSTRLSESISNSSSLCKFLVAYTRTYIH